MARTHVVLPDELLAEIDRIVGQRGRSRFLETAARERLARLALEETLRETAGAVDPDAHPEWADTVATSDWVRSARAEPT